VDVCATVVPAGPVHKNELAIPAPTTETEYPSVLLEQNAAEPTIGLSAKAAEPVPLRSFPQNEPSLKPSLLPPRKLPQAVAVTGNVAVAVVQPLVAVTEIDPLVAAKRKVLTLDVTVLLLCATVDPAGPLHEKEFVTPVVTETEYPSVLFEQNAPGPLIALNVMAGAAPPFKLPPQNVPSANPSLDPPVNWP